MLGIQSSLDCHLSPVVFDQLRQIFQDFGRSIHALILNDRQFQPLPDEARQSPIDRAFLLLYSPHLQALLLGGSPSTQPLPHPPSQPQPCFLTFDPRAIADFGQTLGQFFPDSALWQEWHQLTTAASAASPAASRADSAAATSAVAPAATDPIALAAGGSGAAGLSAAGLSAAGLSAVGLPAVGLPAVGAIEGMETLPPSTTAYHEALLFAVVNGLTQRFDPATSQFSNPALPYDCVSVCQPLEQALQWRLNQEKLLAQVTAQIRQTLELETILNTAIVEVRRLLEVDRVVIYRFEVGAQGQPRWLQPEQLRERLLPSLDATAPLANCRGVLAEHYQAFEALAVDGVPSVLDPQVQPCVFHEVDDWWAFNQGSGVGVTDMEQVYGDDPLLLPLIRQMQVRSRMTTPILVQGHLWGLLTVHQCSGPRPWSEDERSMLEQIAEHLAIAVYQSQLYQALQTQTQTLEERVQAYTQDLQDALAVTQAANRAKSDFLATMSHELRTPLTCIIGMSSTLLRWSFGSLTQRQRNYLQTIHDSGEHLLSIINDILELSQLEAGKTVLNPSSFSLERTVRSIVQLFQDQARSAQVQIHLEMSLADSQDVFLADARRFQQMVTNLISNAIKFTPPEGEVVVRLWRERELAVVQVEDTGIGIPEEQQHLLFQKFQQLENSRIREHGGLGLGLALTKQFVELHGGNIALESTVGRGSKFTIWIPPCTPKMTLPLEVPPSPPILSSGGQVVLLEDDEETATLICELLTAAGYQVIWLVDGSTAVEQVELLCPVAVVTNLAVTGGGVEIIQGLRRSPQTRNLKILALVNATADGALAPPPESARADLYLTKPFSPDQLVASLLQLVS
ncbi:MAG: ATP-binding protein [Prochlorothrix sp.]